MKGINPKSIKQIVKPIEEKIKGTSPDKQTFSIKNVIDFHNLAKFGGLDRLDGISYTCYENKNIVKFDPGMCFDVLGHYKYSNSISPKKEVNNTYSLFMNQSGSKYLIKPLRCYYRIYYNKSVERESARRNVHFTYKHVPKQSMAKCMRNRLRKIFWQEGCI